MISITKAGKLEEQILNFGSGLPFLEPSFNKNLIYSITRYSLTTDYRICFIGKITSNNTSDSKPVRIFASLAELLTTLDITELEFYKLNRLYEISKNCAIYYANLKSNNITNKTKLESNGILVGSTLVPFGFLLKKLEYLEKPLEYWQENYNFKLPFRFLGKIKEEPNKWKVTIEDRKVKIDGSGSPESLIYEVTEEIRKLLWNEMPETIELIIDKEELINDDAFNWYLKERFFLNKVSDNLYAMNLS